jgi:hypothetical protein
MNRQPPQNASRGVFCVEFRSYQGMSIRLSLQKTKNKKMAFMDGFFLDGFKNRLENKICRWFFRNHLSKFYYGQFD